MTRRWSGTLVVVVLACSAHADGPGTGVPDASGHPTSCPGSHTGTWRGTTVGDTLTLDAACVFGYARPGECQSTGTYGAPLGASGSVMVTITASSGGLCLPAGVYSCLYTMAGNDLTFNCGAGLFHYTR